MQSDRAVLLFRIQYTLFLLFYAGLMFFSIVYFRTRRDWIVNALGTSTPLPDILNFACAWHLPWGALACSLPALLLLILAWVIRPNGLLLAAQALLMIAIVFVAIVPMVATELTTANILEQLRAKAIEKGLIKSGQ